MMSTATPGPRGLRGSSLLPHVLFPVDDDGGTCALPCFMLQLVCNTVCWTTRHARKVTFSATLFQSAALRTSLKSKFLF